MISGQRTEKLLSMGFEILGLADPWLANPRNPAMSPHSKFKRLSELTHVRSEGERGVQGWGRGEALALN